MAQILSENSQDAYLFTVTVLDEEDVDFCSIGENESDMEEIFNADDLPPCIVAKRFFEERTTYLADKMKLRVLVVANALDCTLPTRIVLDGLSAIPVELSDKSLEIYV